MLKAPRDRPTIDIPPRKRRRLAPGSRDDSGHNGDSYDRRLLPGLDVAETSSELDFDSPRSVRVRAGFFDVGDLDDEEDVDYEPQGEDEGMSAFDDSFDLFEDEEADLEEELVFLRSDKALPIAAAVTNGRSVEEEDAHYSHLVGLAQLQRAFPGHPIEELDRLLREVDDDAEVAAAMLREIDVLDAKGAAGSEAGDSDSAENEGDEEDDESNDESDEENPEESDEESDEDSDGDADVRAVRASVRALSAFRSDRRVPNDSSSSSSSESSDAEAMHGSGVRAKATQSVDDRASSDDGDSSEDSSDSESDDEVKPADKSGVEDSDATSSDSSSDSDSSEDSDESDGSDSSDDSDGGSRLVPPNVENEPVKPAADPPSAKQAGASDASNASATLSLPNDSLNKSAVEDLQPAEVGAKDSATKPPVEQHLTKSQRRNARKRAKKAEAKAAALSVATSKTELADVTTNATAKEADVTTTTMAYSPLPPEQEPLDSNEAELLLRKEALLARFDVDVAQQDAMEVDNQAQDKSPTTAGSALSQPRMRLDVNAGRRMLFSSLGYRNPKTKEDEDKIRADLMKGVKPLINQRLVSEPAPSNSADAVSPPSNEPVRQHPEHSDSWRDKITYQAVECVEVGLQLSEPPFPFVQRWDFQQQQEKRSLGGSSGANSTPTLPVADLELARNAVPKVPNEGSQFTDVDDLPSLPIDLGSLPSLRPGEAETGMVITWKDWAPLNRTYGWQPQLIDITAVVVKPTEDGDMFTVMLAQRDRKSKKKLKLYDEETGQRLYDKFEVPSLDSDGESSDDEEDTGFRDVAFGGLMEPRILQNPLTTSPQLKLKWDDNFLSAGPPQSPPRGRSPLDYRPVADRPLPSDKAKALQPDTSKGGKLTPIIDIEPRSPLLESPKLETSSPSIESPTFDAELYNGDQPWEAERVVVAATFSGSPKDDIYPTFPTSLDDEGVAPPPESLGELDSPSQQLQQAATDAFDSSFIVSDSLSQGAAMDCSPHPSRYSPLRTDSALLMIPAPALSVTQGDQVIEGKTLESLIDGGSLPFIPSAPSSVRSGRQPGHDIGSDDRGDSFPGVDLASDTSSHVDPSLPPMRTESSPKICPRKANPSEAGSDMSFPSLEEIWHTANSGNTQSPTKSSIPASVKRSRSQPDPDNAYLDAMRQLDEEDGHMEETGAESLTKDLSELSPVPLKLEFASQQSSMWARESGPENVKTPANAKVVTTARTSRESKGFSIPEGSQVIDLISSSPEYQEDYAQDSVDESYVDPDGDCSSALPLGSGWISKSERLRQQDKGRTASPDRQRAGSVPMSLSPRKTSSLPGNPKSSRYSIPAALMDDGHPANKRQRGSRNKGPGLYYSQA